MNGFHSKNTNIPTIQYKYTEIVTYMTAISIDIAPIVKIF